MSLRIVAVSAPYWPEGKFVNHSLKSEDPVSLFNACRYAAFLAENGIGVWGESNWAESRKKRRESILLMNSLKEEISYFDSLLKREKPNLLLIGAMTLCLPGAVAIAKRAREILGEKVCIVLGGWHSTESIYLDTYLSIVKHHVSSPLRMMSEGYIDSVFDLVVSGEAEHLVAKIGDIVNLLDRKEKPFNKICDYLDELSYIPGDWIIGWLKDGKIGVFRGRGYPLNKDELMSPCSMFGVRASFDVFQGRKTAHVFSDSGRGCVYSCDFCSESADVCGSLIQINTSANRLYKQLRDAEKVIKEEDSSFQASAFIEDSSVLAGSTASLQKLVDLFSDHPIDISFGGQLTIDQALARIDVLKELKKVGFDYLFVGIETMNPDLVSGMVKVKRSEDSWIVRSEKLFASLSEIGISCGASLLFGIGETQKSRISLFEQIVKWRRSYKFPSPIAINWAVQHPRKGNDGGANYRYVNWGIPVGPFLDAFKDFGEASVSYPIAGQDPPRLEEVKELVDIYHEILQ